MSPSFIVVIDEPGMGYAEPCYSYEAALRASYRLRNKGYRHVRIKKMEAPKHARNSSGAMALGPE